jgi:4-hydroxymandelate oxidase
MDRREAMKASLLGAATMGISVKGAYAAQSEAVPATRVAETRGVAMTDLPLVSVFDYEAAAKKKLSFAGWEYYDEGTGDAITMKRNRSALDGLQLKPRTMVDVTNIDVSCTVLGFKMAHPIILAPAASHQYAHPEGEVATARGAAEADATMMLSTNSNRSIEDVYKAATTPVWFQLYVDDDRGMTRSLIERAEAAGNKVLVVTADNPVSYARNREERSAPLTPKLPFPNLDTKAVPGARGRSRKHLNWADLEWIQSFAKTPIILKGILNPDDAEEAVHRGVAGIVVSNHGGRVLDTVPASIEVLPAVVDRVAGRVPILFDSGIRRGTDIMKAIGYGASAVLIGRAYLYGLAVGGSDGVRDVVKILKTELQEAMAMMGRTHLAELDRTVFWKSKDYSS